MLYSTHGVGVLSSLKTCQCCGQEHIGYHCFRGLLTPDTEVFFTPAAIRSSASQHSPSIAATTAGLSYLHLHSPTDAAHAYEASQTGQPRIDGASSRETAEVLSDRKEVHDCSMVKATGVLLLNARPPPISAGRNIVNVHTRDGTFLHRAPEFSQTSMHPPEYFAGKDATSDN